MDEETKEWCVGASFTSGQSPFVSLESLLRWGGRGPSRLGCLTQSLPLTYDGSWALLLPLPLPPKPILPRAGVVVQMCGVWASLVAQMGKNLPAMQENLVQSLGREDPLEKEMATHSSILAWRIPWTVEPDGLQSIGLQRVGHN